MEEQIAYEDRHSLGLEDVASHLDFFSPQDLESIAFGGWSTDQPTASLPEDDALRIAEVLDDYEQVSVTDIGGTDESGYFVSFTDERFHTEHSIRSEVDYWSFIGWLTQVKPWPVSRIREAVAWMEATTQKIQHTCTVFRPSGSARGRRAPLRRRVRYLRLHYRGRLC